MTLSFVDIETTGARMNYDRIIEIGILRVEDGKIVKTYEQLVNPGIHVSPFITQITGIATEDVVNAPTFEEIKEELYEILEDSIFVAHNVRFDYGFIKNEFRRFGMSFQSKQLCTVKLSRMLYPQYKKHSLDALIERFQFDCERRHRAFDDAKILWDFYQITQKEHPIDKLDSAYNLILKKPTLPAALAAAQIEKLPETPGVYLFYDVNNNPLYIGKSINIKDRVLSHFSNDYNSTKEMAMCQQVAYIEHIETAGELGALLKEAHLIKQVQPIYNRKLRRTKKLALVKLKKLENGYDTVEITEAEAIAGQDVDEVLGIYPSVRKAKEYIKYMAKDEGLCEKILGLEKTTNSCFNFKLERCKGACVGREPAVFHNVRLMQAFHRTKIKTWPFEGPIVIREQDAAGERSDQIMVNKWCLMQGEDQDLMFDQDVYKILVRFIFDKKNARNISTVSHDTIKDYSSTLYVSA
ncbi:MAG: exonuclease domain-containing protein [Weeksellaceae bacterium]